MPKTVTIRLNENFQAKVAAKAAQQKKSLNAVINEMLAFGSLVDDLTDDQSQIVIRKAKGYEANQEVVVPNPDKIYGS